VVVAAVATIAALSPGPRDSEDAGALVPGGAATPAPTTTTVAVTTTSETTTTRASTTTTTAAPRTTGPPTTRRTTTTRQAGNQLVTVPNVVGQDIGDAAAELSRRGLGTRVQAVPTRRRSQLGEVVRQEPAAGARVPQGTAVSVTVAMWLDRGPRD
jgi:hypothetical protein